MTYRPYPSPVRARHQVERHVHVQPEMTMSDALWALSLAAGQALANAEATLRRIFPFPPVQSDPGSSAP